jgi:hypothetical protein
MLDKLASLARRHFYSYRPGVVAGNLGVGFAGYGLMKPQSDPLYAPYPTNRAVRASLNPLQTSHLKTEQLVTDVALVGNGAQLTGALALQALAQFQQGQN